MTAAVLLNDSRVSPRSTAVHDDDSNGPSRAETPTRESNDLTNSQTGEKAMEAIPMQIHPQLLAPSQLAVDATLLANGVARPPCKVSNQGNTSSTTHGTNNKGGPTSERDSINALLSLGRDLQAGESEDTESSTQIQALSKRAPQPLLPATLGIKPSKKRPKKNPETMIPKVDNGYQYPPDFWYWLPPGESVGEWDVLCGRGGESNNFIGNRKYRNMVNERKPAYREIPLKNRKAKTAFVRGIVQHVNNCGGRFVDLDETSGQYYVVTMDKARKKTSQALRETKELKWLDLSEAKERKVPIDKNTICPYCKKPGHKTKIAKACLKHHEWLDANINTENPTEEHVEEPETDLGQEMSTIDSTALTTDLPDAHKGVPVNTTESNRTSKEFPSSGHDFLSV